jgi:hypothetical protein
MIDPRAAVAAIVARDGLQQLAADDVDRLVALYAEMQPELAQLRAAEVSAAEPAVIFPAE